MLRTDSTPSMRVTGLSSLVVYFPRSTMTSRTTPLSTLLRMPLLAVNPGAAGNSCFAMLRVRVVVTGNFPVGRYQVSAPTHSAGSVTSAERHVVAVGPRWGGMLRYMRTLAALVGSVLAAICALACLGFAAAVVYQHELVRDRFQFEFYVLPAAVAAVGLLFLVGSVRLAIAFVRPRVPST